MIAPAAVLALAAAALSATALSAQACPDAAAITHGVRAPLAHVRYLADDALEGRMAGTASERCAGDYIATHFRRLGLRPAGDAGTYFQTLSLASALNPHAPGGAGRNVVALLPGGDPALAGEAVVIGAHYDHLGHGGRFSMSPADTAVHNGADDNASGVAALLAIAERLSRGPRPARTIVFVAFTGEEEGLLGSAFHAANPAVPLERTRAMLNLDMVGRLGAGPLIVYGVDTADEWRAMVDGAAAAEGVQVRGGGDGFGASDQTSFYARGLPVLHFFTNVHTDYHRSGDDWEKIDAAGLERVAAIVARVAREVSARPGALTFRRVAPVPRAAASGGGYGAYLGTIPDFTPVPDGVKLSGVRAGSPAEQAGIRAGDVLVRLGEMDVHDLQGMTNALRAHKPGDVVRVDVLRDGTRVTVTATLGTRGG
ncbi:MAG TPA: M20/M25/M40 family metallo-hydrolase [Longimicrobium sp.]|nr:M20/M25/M40 family metallo-hydrolase [Longimicrobium sp.]